MRVVLDTNILVSALMKPNGSEARTLLLALRGHFELCLSPAVLAEYERVLPRPELKLSPQEIHATLENIRQIGRLVRPTLTLSASPHESDNRFYECSDAADAHYLVIGNTRHFPVGHGKTRIVTARQFLAVIEGHKE